MKKKVLIIDDNPQNNSRYIEALMARYHVSVAMKIVSAIRLIKHDIYDFIVIDVMMPCQGILSPSEMYTGYVFYRDYLMPLNLDSKIVFWSRFGSESYEEFWGVPPKNVSFVHKGSQINHLLDHLVQLEKE